MRPLPLRLLKHSIDYKKLTGDDRFGDDPFDAPVAITHVRVEPSSTLKRTSNEEQIIGDYVMFMDRVNTEPFIVPEEKDQIIFKEETMEVKKIRKLYDGDEIHHLEVGLI